MYRATNNAQKYESSERMNEQEVNNTINNLQEQSRNQRRGKKQVDRQDVVEKKEVVDRQQSTDLWTKATETAKGVSN